MRSLDKPLIIWKIEVNSRKNTITRQWWKNEVTNGHDWNEQKKSTMKKKILYIFSLYLHLSIFFSLNDKSLKLWNIFCSFTLYCSSYYWASFCFITSCRPDHWSVYHWICKDEDFGSFGTFAGICKFPILKYFIIRIEYLQK